MKKCLFCEKELTSDMGYITDGKIDVCVLCAGRHSLNDIYLRVASDGIDSNIQRVFVPAFESDESGLTGQTDSAIEYAMAKDQLNPIYVYGMPVSSTAESDESGLTGQTDSVDYGDPATYEGMPEPDDDMPERDADMPTVQDDIENLSEEDFMSKYADYPFAIDSYMEFHKLGVYADELDESGNESV